MADSEDTGPELPEIDTPLNLRPDLSLYGIEEFDRGVCADTAENRQTLRANKLSWVIIFDTLGHSTDMIEVRNAEMLENRGLAALDARKAILEDPRDKNSEYLTGYDLLYADTDNTLVPAWIISATRTYMEVEKKRLEFPDKKIKAQLTAPPSRCKMIKSDGIRCMLWSAGREHDRGLCRIHVGSLLNTSAGAVEKARKRLSQQAPYAADILVELAESATSEPVRLKAASEILDRAGVRGGVEIDMNATLEVKPAGEVLRDRMEKLRMSAETVHELTATPQGNAQESDIVDAEVVEDDK